MLNRILVRCSLLLTFALVLGAAPALAQERGKSGEHENGKAAAQRRPELQRRGEDDGDDQGDRKDDKRARTGTAARATNGRRAGVPPGWCQGTNNPHNTVENCGSSATRTRSTRSGGVNGNSSSYEAAHLAYHRNLDQRYRELAAQRPLDVQRQLQLRAQKSAEHERWHAQAGVNSR
jgi:hypothetical protein